VSTVQADAQADTDAGAAGGARAASSAGSAAGLLGVALAAGGSSLLLASAALHLGVAAVLGAIVLVAVAVRALSTAARALDVLILALPLGLSQRLALGPVDLIHVVGAAVVVLVMLHRLAQGRTPLRWHPSARWAVCLLCLVAAATVTARDPVLALRQTIALAVAVALALAINAACARRPDLRRAVLLLAVVGGAICLYSLRDAGSITAVADNAGAVDNRAVGIFSSPNELGTFSGVLTFVGLGLALGARTRVERVVGSACALAAGAALLLSLSRGGWIGCLLAVVALVVLSPKARRIAPAVALAAVVGVPVVVATTAPQLWGILQERAATVTRPETNPDDARGLIFREAVRQSLQRPLTGQGPGNYPIAASTSEATAPSVDALHAHDVLLDVAAETGLPAAAALVALTVSMARRVLRCRERLPPPDRELMVGLACGLVVVVGQGLVDFPFRNPTLLFLTWTVLGLLFAATMPAPTSAGNPPYGPRPRMSVRHGGGR
jgi:putative inorganic carbon (hco3(-)) transporter